ncbi:hypothetical protein [Actinoplanes subglobosus]|uniref:Uncharacterized protein n=1 Tax=Actinoplanes subglobosus TaxID=1547892 RepID=A0ABV8J7U1_9ACTN
MTDKLPELPQAYQPPPSVLVDESEPALVPPDDPAPIAPRRRSRTGLVVVTVLVLAAVVWGFVRPAPAREPAALPPGPAPAASPVFRLEAIPGSAERSRRWRITEGAPTSIYFANDTGETVTVNRLTEEQERIRYAEIEPGQGYHQDTYAGHVWVITKADGTAVALFRAIKEPGLAEIR